MRVLPIGSMAFLMLAGCANKADPCVAVRGRICFQGEPLSKGLVVFSPDPRHGGHGPLARAQVQRDGNYELLTDDQAGAYPGWYRVTVVATDSPRRVPGEKFLFPRSLLPDKYRDPEMSGLVREIKAGRKNQIDLDLQ